MKNDSFRIDVNGPVTPEEIIAVREQISGDVDVWRQCIAQSFCIVTARDTIDEKLLGIGFLAGNSRHCQIVDLSVHSLRASVGLADAS